jgi:predicted DNA binding CopG/RHH family protein
MSNKISDPAKPIGQVTIVKDFLPPPEQLVPKNTTVRVTMEFSQETIEYFKREAKQNNLSYKSMIRDLLDVYVKQHNL